MANLIFYEKTVPLDRVLHKDKRISVPADFFRFAAKTNSVLLAGGEFSMAALSYPIVFVGDPKQAVTAAALLGLRDAENLFVDESGRWEQGAYVPAFVRRYPFVLAEGDADDKVTVCIDAAFTGLGEAEGERLFEEDGRESAYLERNIEFLRRYRAEMTQTAEFARTLVELDLLVPKTVAIEMKDKKTALDGFMSVDENRLATLKDDQVLMLWKKGYMAWIFLHLASLNNVSRLAGRLSSEMAK